MKQIYLITILIIFSCFFFCSKPADERDYDNPYDMLSPAYQPGVLTATFSPEDGGKGVNPFADIIINFSLPVIQNNWLVNIDGEEYTSGSFDGTGKILTIEQGTPFLRNDEILVTLINFISDDIYKVELVEDCRLFEFTVAEAPTAQFSPLGGAKDININSEIIITFSEPMKTDNDWQVEIDSLIYNKSSSEILWSGESQILTVSPAGLFQRDNYVSVNIFGFMALLDDSMLNGNLQATFETIKFPTASFDPTDSEISVSPEANIVITFSEPMDHNDSWDINVNAQTYDNTSPYISWSGNSLIINPVAAFLRGSLVSLAIEDFTAEIDSYPISGTKSISFSIDDSVLPGIANLNPRYGQTDVSPYTTINITFSESMDTDNGWSVHVYDMYSSMCDETFDKDSTRISWDGNTLTINPQNMDLIAYPWNINVVLSGFVAALDGYPLEYSYWFRLRE